MIRPGGLALPLLAAAVSSVALAVAMARPQTLHVEASDPEARRVLRAFGAPFARSQRSGLWSEPESSIVLHGVGAGPSVVTLRISGGMPGRPQTLSLNPVGGARRVEVDPAAFPVTPGSTEYPVRLTVAPWPPSVAPVELALSTTPYRHGADGRQLGVRLLGLSVMPAGGAVARLASALPVAALWAWTLALVGVLITRIGRRFAPTMAVGPVAAAAVGAAGALLAAYAWRDPHGFAWALPPLIAAPVLVTTILLVSAADERAMVSSPRGFGRAGLGALVAFCALAVLYVQRGGIAPALIALVIGAGWMVARWPRAGAAEHAGGASRVSLPIWLGLAAVVIVAVAMRFLWIRDLPYGLWRDDARYGLAALRMIEDPVYRPGFVLEVNLPALGMRMLGLGLQAWGIASWSMRTVPALAGALAVIALFGLARRLTGRGDTALLAAAFLAVSSWHVTVSRITSPAAIHPLFELAGLWCLAEGWAIGRAAPLVRPWRELLLFAGGACIGVSLQTYQSGRASPLVAAAFVAAFWPARRAAGGRWRDLAVVVAGFAVAGAPLLGYAWRDWRNFNARAGVVFVPAAAAADATAPLGALDASLGRHLLMFNVEGDSQGRRNVPLRAMLDPVTGLGFLAGLLALFRARGDARASFLLGALVLGLVPSALAIEGPHALRAIGGVAYACLIAAVGWRALANHAPVSSPRTGVLALVAVAALAFNAWTYFLVGARDERVWGSFYTVETKVGSFVRDRARSEGPAAAARIHLTQEMSDSWVVRFLVHGLPVGAWDTALAAPVPPDALFVVAHEPDREKLFALAEKRAQGTPELAGFGPLRPDGRPSFSLYRLP